MVRTAVWFVVPVVLVVSAKDVDGTVVARVVVGVVAEVVVEVVGVELTVVCAEVDELLVA